jgi:low temperature requirement protein LtrA
VILSFSWTCKQDRQRQVPEVSALLGELTLNTADEPEAAGTERHASWAELFFDLVAVAGVAALAHVLGSELDAAALGLYALLFLAFWLSWTTFMLYSNVAADQTRVVRLLIGMFGLGVMAASVR